MQHLCSLSEREFVSNPRASRLLMLAPRAKHTDQWRNRSDRDELIARVQRLRGRIYLKDKAIHERDLMNGLHHMTADSESWHILFENHGEIKGCVRARLHHPLTDHQHLGIRDAAIAKDAVWGQVFSAALQAEIELAQELQIPLLEVGGLALDETIRGSSALLQMVFAIYGLARTLGGAIGISTVTRRHRAAMILRRLGGQSLEHSGTAIPGYFDPRYGCEMEVLRFYSWTPNLKHERKFAALQRQFSEQIPSRAFQHWKNAPSAFAMAQ